MIENLIQQLGNELQMEDQIVHHEPGHYTLPLEDNVKVDIFQKDNYAVLKSPIEKLPSKNTDAFVEKIMENNLFGRTTRGTVIGLNAEGDTLTLTMEVDNQTSYKSFYEKLEDFITVQDYWRKEAAK